MMLRRGSIVSGLKTARNAREKRSLSEFPYYGNFLAVVSRDFANNYNFRRRRVRIVEGKQRRFTVQTYFRDFFLRLRTSLLRALQHLFDNSSQTFLNAYYQNA